MPSLHRSDGGEQFGVFVITHGLSPMAGIGFADLASGRRLKAVDLILIGLAGAAPDILSPHLSLEARLNSWTHNVWFLLGAIPVFCLVARLAKRPRWIVVASLMALATAFHLFCDAISGGIAWLHPFSDERIARRWVPYKYWLTLDVVFVALTALLCWLRRRGTRPAHSADSPPSP